MLGDKTRANAAIVHHHEARALQNALQDELHDALQDELQDALQDALQDELQGALQGARAHECTNTSGTREMRHYAAGGHMQQHDVFE